MIYHFLELQELKKNVKIDEMEIDSSIANNVNEAKGDGNEVDDIGGG